MALQCFFSYSHPSTTSTAQQCTWLLDSQVTASRKRPSQVELAELQEFNYLQEIVWRDVDEMKKVSSRESQVVAEQLRRKRMKSLSTHLESLLPATPPKLDRCGLYEEAINYITKLQDDLHQLQRKRDHLLAIQSGKTGENKNIDVKVSMEIYDREAIVSITSQRRPRYIWRILEELENHGLDVETSQLFTGESIVLLYFHVNLRDNISDDPAKIRSCVEGSLKLSY